MFQEMLSTLSIRYIESDKLRQTNCDRFLYNFVMKKVGQNLFQLFTVLCSYCVHFFFFIYISMTV